MTTDILAEKPFIAHSVQAPGKQKYRNHAQLVQGVSQVRDPPLSQGERLFLNALAAFNVKTDPHPGNEKLMVACGITSRKGVNYIANKLVAKKLIQIVEVGTGRGKATVYRINTHDARFPFPAKQGKPGSLHFHDSERNPEFHPSAFGPEKPGSPGTQNPEVSVPETRKSELPYGFKDSDTSKDKTALPNPLMPGKAPAQEGLKQTEFVIWIYGERVYVKKPAHRRLWTQREKEAMHGQRAPDYVQFFINKGFESYILPPE